MLRCFAEKQHDWERYLPLVMFAYRTSVHASTKVAPFSLMFGRVLQTSLLAAATAFEPVSYSAQLHAKFANLCCFVETSLSEAATAQKRYYDIHTKEHVFHQGDLVWLSIPTTRNQSSTHDGKVAGQVRRFIVWSMPKFQMVSV